MSKAPAAFEAKKRNLTEEEKADGWLLLRKMATVLAKTHKLTEGERVALQHILTGDKWTIGGKKARDEVAKKMGFTSTEDLKRAVIENLACHVVGFARKAGYEVNSGDDTVMFLRIEDDYEEEGNARD